MRRRIPLLTFLVWAWVAGRPVSGADTYAGPDTCAACHAEIFTEWKASLHARGYSDEKFRKAGESTGRKPDCLACHTTGHVKGSRTFQFPGVTCESCHGAMTDGHPGETPMPIPIGSDMCKKCHGRTFMEWQVSRHGTKGIRCFDCHKAHGQGLRAGGGDKLCGSCHAERLKDFAHATHRQEGLSCSTCHLPGYPDKDGAIEGTGAASHALAVGADVCARCHEENVHKSANLPSLREKVTEYKEQMAVAGVDNVYELNEEVKDLKWRMNRIRQSVWVVGLLMLLTGLVLGWLVAWYALRQRRHERD